MKNVVTFFFSPDGGNRYLYHLSQRLFKKIKAAPPQTPNHDRLVKSIFIWAPPPLLTLESCPTHTKSPQSSAPPDHATSPIQESDLLPEANRVIPPKPTGSPSTLLRGSLAMLFLGGDSTRFDSACASPRGSLSLMS